MTLKEASQYLRIAKRTLYNWCSEKKIPSIKLGGVKFAKEDLDDLIEKRKRHCRGI
jgi:excisionase family DNA binding protein|tara:strand:- start:563 stop:730 length:168 start_codon:yes stop_codon:yes gene_type:complete